MNEPINVQVSAAVERVTEWVCGTGDVLVSAGCKDGDPVVIFQKRPDSIPNKGIGECAAEFPPLRPGDTIIRFKNVESLDVVLSAMIHCRLYFEQDGQTGGAE